MHRVPSFLPNQGKRACLAEEPRLAPGSPGQAPGTFEWVDGWSLRAASEPPVATSGSRVGTIQRRHAAEVSESPYNFQA